MRMTLSIVAFLFASLMASAARAESAVELVESRMIWNEAPHNAFTDLVRFGDRFLCVFREGQGHVSPDGAIRVIGSADGAEWKAVARITSSAGDLRDPKITLAPDGRLMLIAAAAKRAPDPPHHQTLVWFSKDGATWSEPAEIGEANNWLWRVTWHNGTCYGVGYRTSDERLVRLYQSPDGVTFSTLVASLFDKGYPNESSLIFLPDQSALCLLRRDGKEGTAQLGRSAPPYADWKWHDLGKNIGGPHMLRLDDGRIIAAGRAYDNAVRTALFWIDSEHGAAEECLALPSGGDTSYPGLVWHDSLLWVSYYSSHEGQTRIYLAKVQIPPTN